MADVVYRELGAGRGWEVLQTFILRLLIAVPPKAQIAGHPQALDGTDSSTNEGVGDSSQMSGLQSKEKAKRRKRRWHSPISGSGAFPGMTGGRSSL